MTKPYIKTFDGGSLKIIRLGDTYQKPSKDDPTPYERPQLKLTVTISKKEIEIPRNVWFNMIATFTDDPICQEFLKVWE
jgi:hypothetical protein